MKNIFDFLDKWATRICFPLIIIIFLKTCSTNSKIDKTRTELSTVVTRIDSVVSISASKQDIEKIIKIEGLKSEKRMIQSTDRKILDVTRQSEIDKELEKLGSK